MHSRILAEHAKAHCAHRILVLAHHPCDSSGFPSFLSFQFMSPARMELPAGCVSKQSIAYIPRCPFSLDNQRRGVALKSLPHFNMRRILAAQIWQQTCTTHSQCSHLGSLQAHPAPNVCPIRRHQKASSPCARTSVYTWHSWKGAGPASIHAASMQIST